MRFSCLIEDFLFYCDVERGLSPHTIDSYKHDLNQYAAFLESELSAKSALKEHRLKLFLTDMSRRRGLSTSTVRRRLACLKSLSKFAFHRHAIANPFLTWSPTIKRSKQLPKALHRKDVAQLLSPNNDYRDDEVAFIVMILGATGLRISELCSITVKDVAETGDTIRVVGKGSRDRIVYLTHRKMILAMEARRSERLRAGGIQASIFLNTRGAPMKPQTLRRRLHNYAGGLGFDRKVTPHMLRHTAATLLIEEGADIRFVQRLLGHASISTTEIYTHVSNEALRSVVDQANTIGRFLDAH